jgi:hypothetical protein
VAREIGKILLVAGMVAMAFFGTEAWLWSRYVTKAFAAAESGSPGRNHKPTEAEARAQADAGVQWWLAAHYGPLDVPANREKALLSFFDAKHIKELYVFSRLRTADQYRGDVEAAARWIAKYRSTMSPEERADLQARLNSDSGRAMLHEGNAQFQSMDVSWRGKVKPAVTEILTTLSDLQKQ